MLLLPPVRSAAGPGVTRIALRSFGRSAPLLSYASTFTESFTRNDYIDGEVIDVHDVEPAALNRPVTGEPEHWGGPRYAAGPN